MNSFVLEHCLGDEIGYKFKLTSNKNGEKMIVCNDRNGSCRKNICECDKRLVERLTQQSGRTLNVRPPIKLIKTNGTRATIKALVILIAKKNVNEVEVTRFWNLILLVVSFFYYKQLKAFFKSLVQSGWSSKWKVSAFRLFRD